jgi:hypothetical protein
MLNEFQKLKSNTLFFMFFLLEIYFIIDILQ